MGDFSKIRPKGQPIGDGNQPASVLDFFRQIDDIFAQVKAGDPRKRVGMAFMSYEQAVELGLYQHLDLEPGDELLKRLGIRQDSP